MKSGLITGSLFITSALLTGCGTLSPTTLSMNYQLKQSSSTLHASKHQAIAVDVKDNRGLSDPHFLVYKRGDHKQNARSLGEYAVLAYADKHAIYYTKHPVSYIVHDAFTKAISQMGYQPKKASDYILSSNIENITHSFHYTWGWTPSTSGDETVSITLNTQLYDATKHKVLWHDRLVGHQTLVFGHPKKHRMMALFTGALNDAMHQLQTSHTFVDTLNNQ